LVGVQLQDSVPGGLYLDLNVDLFSLMELLLVLIVAMLFSLDSEDKLWNVVVDLSSVAGLIDSHVSLQVCIGNIHLNLNLDIDIALDLSGLNNLLDCLFDVLGLNTIVDDLLGNLLGNNDLLGGLLGGGSSSGSTGSTGTSSSGSVVIDKPIFDPIPQILSCPILLDVDIDLGCVLNVDLEVLLFSSSNVLISQVIPVSLSGIAGEVAYVDIGLAWIEFRC
jgi:hypothetical protein